MKKRIVFLLIGLLAACVPTTNTSSEQITQTATSAPLATIGPNKLEPALTGRVLIVNLPNIYLANADGNNNRLIYTFDTPPNMFSLSPDGKKLAFLQNNAVFVENTDTQQITPISHEMVGGIGSGTEMRWSPEGKKFAFSCSTPKHPDPSICVMDAQSGELDALLERQTVGGQCSALNLISLQFELADWSQDGTKIVVICYQATEKGQKGYFGVYIYDLNLKTIQEVLDDSKQDNIQYIRGAVISPDDKTLLLTGILTDKTWQIFRIRIDGSGFQQITAGDGFSFENPVWNPDGTDFYVFRWKNGNTETLSQLLDVDGKVLMSLDLKGGVVAWIK